jgi:hypothetical protein
VASLQELRREGLALDVQLGADAAGLAPVVSALPFVAGVAHEGSRLQVRLADAARAPDVVEALVKAGARIHAVTRAARPLEEAYLELVREEDAP